MSSLICPNCEPRSPPVRGNKYYAIDVEEKVSKDGIVDPESGAIRRSDHIYSREVIYAECTDCGEVLVDKR